MVANFYLSLWLVLVFLHCAFGVDLVDDTCKKASKDDPNVHYEFCVASLGGIPKSHYANLRGLGRISINLTKSNATHTIPYIQSLLKMKKLSPYVKSCLMDCVELYSDGISSLDTGIVYFKHKHYYEANIYVSAAMDAPTTCEDGFTEGKGVVSPLTKRNNDMFQLAAIALTIINMCN